MNQLIRIRIVHFASQVPDIDIDDVGDSLEALVPYMLENHGAREHAVWRGQQIFQQRVFLAGQLDGLSAAAYLVRQTIQFEVGDEYHVGTLDGSTPQQRLNAHQQLREVEWFGQIIIRAGLEVPYLVLSGIAGGEYQH